MQRETIPLDELCLPVFAAWEPGWFLLTAGENRPGEFNSMTVSWGAFGVIWHRPLLVVVLRPQRYTREFMERSDTFSLCAFDAAQRPALELLGTQSGADAQDDRMRAHADRAEEHPLSGLCRGEADSRVPQDLL